MAFLSKSSLTSGSPVTLIPTSMYKKTLAHHRLKTLPPANIKLTSATGSPLIVHSHVLLPFFNNSHDFDCEHNVLVVDNLPAGCILGTDFLRAHKILIDF